MLATGSGIEAQTAPGVLEDMRRITVKLPDELDALLCHEAARRGMTVSQ